MYFSDGGHENVFLATFLLRSPWHKCRLVVEHDDQPCVLARFGTDVLFTNQAKASIWQLSGNGEELSLFAGSDEEDGSSDGPVKESRFKQPVGICTEFDSVVYVVYVTLKQTLSRSAAR